MDFRDLYKNRRIPTLSATVAKHYQDIITCRQEKQREFFWSKRGQPEIATQKREALEKKKATRMEMLMKWKEEKLKKQEEEKKKCRPIFKVGVVQKKITGSPLIIEKKNCKSSLQKKDQRVMKSQIKDNEKNCEGIMTRSKTRIQRIVDENTIKDQRQLNPVKGGDQKPKTDFKLNNKFCKVEIGKVKRVNSVVFKVPDKVAALPYCNKLTFPNSPNITKTKNLSLCKSYVEETAFQGSSTMSKMCINNNNNVENKIEFKSLQKVSEMPKSTEPKNLNSNGSNEIYYSPFATIKNKGEHNEAENKECEFQCRISLFRDYIFCKTKLLLEKCENWKNICIDFEGPSEIQDEVDSVIGKTKLLTSDKFLQFKNLIDKCDEGDPLINIDDLEGFKDWVSIEVEKINDSFEKLEKLKQNNWISETFPVENSKIRRKKNCINKKPPSKSNIRAHIQAARKMLKNENPDYGIEAGEIKNHNENISIGGSTKNNLESPADNNHTSNFYQLLPVNVERRNFISEMTISSQTNGILFKNENSAVLRGSGVKNVGNNKVKVQANIICQNYQNYQKGSLRTTSSVLNSSRNHFNLKCDSENLSKGLNEKYFRHPENDDRTPARRVLREMNSNVTPVRIMTRSKCDKYQII